MNFFRKKVTLTVWEIATLITLQSVLAAVFRQVLNINPIIARWLGH